MSDPEVRILLVDDEKDIRDQISAAFAPHNWKIDEFGDVESAANAVRELRMKGREYDAAILDFRLPMSSLDRRTPVDVSLCNLVRNKTLVWHISVFLKDDPEIKAHVAACHSPDEQLAIIAKGVGFIEELESQIRRALAARRIKVSLNMLQPGPSASGYARRFRPDPAETSVTNLLARLCGDIKRFWNDLTPAFQSELAESFEIELGPNGKVENVFPK